MERRRQCIDGDGIQDVASPVHRRHGAKDGDDYILSRFEQGGTRCNGKVAPFSWCICGGFI